MFTGYKIANEDVWIPLFRKEVRFVKVSTRGRYALKMLTDLAIHQGEGYINLKEISQRQGVSKKYLEQIVPILNREEILQTSRGSQGGYRLAKRPNEYVIGDILRLTEGSLTLAPWLDDGIDSSNMEFWAGLNEAVSAYLNQFTLQDLVDEEKSRYAYDYVI